jgi:uncharacterized protein
MTRLSWVPWRTQASLLLLILLLRDQSIVEGFRGVFAPIQPVFSLAASPRGDKVTSKSNKLQPTFVNFPGGTLEFSWHTSIADIPAKVWDGCLPNSSLKNQTTGRSPFLEHSWLRCLEATECVSEATGWTPQHLSIHIHHKSSNSTRKIGQRTKSKPKPSVIMDGCVPAYIKTHSMGEFIFDDSWADAAFRNGVDYYPKLLIGVPFTPVTGPRILWHSQVWTSMSSETIDELNRAVGKFLKQSATARGWSSVHINFCSDQEATALAGPLELMNRKGQEAASNEDGLAEECDKFLDDGIQIKNNGNDDKDIRQQLQAILHQQLKSNDTNSYLRRSSLQYQWNNRNPYRGGKPYQDFEEYLSCFKSKRRITIRRERRKARQDNNIRIEPIRGSDILKVEGLIERMFEIYLSTVDKMFWGRQYLTLEFFEMICRTPFVNNLCFFCVRYEKAPDIVKNDTALRNGKSKSWTAEDVFAGTVNVVKDGVFYGRYWGCLPGHDVKNLHFETCYWSAIDYCIENGLKRMEPGAGGAGTAILVVMSATALRKKHTHVNFVYAFPTLQTTNGPEDLMHILVTLYTIFVIRCYGGQCLSFWNLKLSTTSR